MMIFLKSSEPKGMHEGRSHKGRLSVAMIAAMAILCLLPALVFDLSEGVSNTMVTVLGLSLVAGATACVLASGHRISEEEWVVLLFAVGFLLRLDYVLYTPVNLTEVVRQHDVGFFGTGSYWQADYIEWFYQHPFRLPEDPTLGQFYHPPLHFWLAALWMHLQTALGMSYGRAVAGLPLLSLFYSSCCMIATDRILKGLRVRGTGRIAAAALAAFHPTFILMAASVNNDILSVLFILLAADAAIRWYQNPSVKRILLIAVWIGLGMMTKLTAAIVAVPIAVLFLLHLIRAIREERDRKICDGASSSAKATADAVSEKRKERSSATDYTESVYSGPELNSGGPSPSGATLWQLVRQYAAFACVSFPLGLWFPLYKLICHGVPLTYVLASDAGSAQYIGYYTVWERLFDLSAQPFQTVYENWTVFYEYNPFVALLKTSLFGEWTLAEDGTVITKLAWMLLLLNVILILVSILAMVWCGIDAIRARRSGRKGTESRAIRLFLVIYQLFSFAFYLRFCLDYPLTCSMDYRYIAPTCAVGAVLIGLLLNRLEGSVSAAGFRGVMARLVQYGIVFAVVLFCCLSMWIYFLLGI